MPLDCILQSFRLSAGVSENRGRGPCPCSIIEELQNRSFSQVDQKSGLQRTDRQGRQSHGIGLRGHPAPNFPGLMSNFRSFITSMRASDVGGLIPEENGNMFWLQCSLYYMALPLLHSGSEPIL